MTTEELINHLRNGKKLRNEIIMHPTDFIKIKYNCSNSREIVVLDSENYHNYLGHYNSIYDYPSRWILVDESPQKTKIKWII